MQLLKMVLYKLVKTSWRGDKWLLILQIVCKLLSCHLAVVTEYWSVMESDAMRFGRKLQI